MTIGFVCGGAFLSGENARLAWLYAFTTLGCMR